MDFVTENGFSYLSGHDFLIIGAHQIPDLEILHHGAFFGLPIGRQDTLDAASLYFLLSCLALLCTETNATIRDDHQKLSLPKYPWD
jgi:hypothetical protein